MERYLYRITLLLALALIVLSGGEPSHAQDDAREQILDAYRAYETWRSYHVQVDETSDYAMTAQGQQAALWQKRERDLSLAGGYDVANRENARIALEISSRVTGSIDQDGQREPEAWELELSIARTSDGLFWRGTLDADPPGTFALPEAWARFTGSEASEVPALSDLLLSHYLLEESADPFVVDADAWLDAAESIEGPRPFNLDRATPSELYVVTVNPAEAPGVFEGRFLALTEGQDALVARGDLLDRLAETGSVTWGVALHPDTGDLLAQFLQIDLSAEVRGSLLQSPYTSLSLAFRSNQSVVFSAVNEPVTLPDDLPPS